MKIIVLLLLVVCLNSTSIEEDNDLIYDDITKSVEILESLHSQYDELKYNNDYNNDNNNNDDDDDGLIINENMDYKSSSSIINKFNCSLLIPCNSTGRVKNTELYQYSDKHMHPNIIKWRDSGYKNTNNIVTEIGEQIYMINFTTIEFANKIIEEADSLNLWEVSYNNKEKNPNPQYNDIIEESEPDTTVQLNEMSCDIEMVYFKMVDYFLEKLAKELWEGFEITKKDPPYMLKYETTVIDKMKLHWDNEIITFILYLNNNFCGGGTEFPRWNLTVGREFCNDIIPTHKINIRTIPGTLVMYPGGISHLHRGLRIHSGQRYLFLSAFY